MEKINEKQMKIRTLFILICTTLFIGMNAQNAKQVFDINKQPTPVGSDPRAFAAIGDNLYFTANDNIFGDEMRIYDGKNLKFVKDIYPGSYGSKPKYFTLFNGKIYFSASDKEHGTELWVYEEGSEPQMAMDIAPGSNGISPAGLTVFNNMLCFGGYGGENGHIYMLDTNGVLHTSFFYRPYVRAYRFGADNDERTAFVSYNGRLYFGTPFAEYGDELTGLVDSAGNYRYWDLIDGKKGSNPNDFVVYKDRMFFTATTEELGREVMAINDSNKITTFIDINKGEASSRPKNFKILNDTLWFEAKGSTGIYELFNYGGGNEYNDECTLVDDIGVAFNDIIASYKGNYYYTKKVEMPYGFCKSDDSFDEDDEYYYRDSYTIIALMEYNPRTKEKKTLYGGKYPLEMEVEHGFTIYKDQLVFCANNGESGNEVWTYNGIGNPKLMIDVLKGSYGSSIKNITIYNDNLYFTANDGIHGREIWEYDRVNPPHILIDINKGAMGSNPSELIVAAGKLCFLAEQNNDVNLWIYDGTKAPQIISSMYDDANFQWASSLRLAKNALVFSGSKTDNKSLLWQYDGKSTPERFEIMGGDVMSKYFNSINFPYWETNSEIKRTYSGDELESSFVGNDIASFDEEAFVIGNKKVVIGYSPEYGLEPWVYTNSEIPELLMDINSGPGDSYFGNVFNFKDMLCFTAYDRNDDKYLWKYNGKGEPIKVAELDTYRDDRSFKYAIYNNNVYYTDYLEEIGDVIMMWDGAGKPKVYYDIDPEYSSANVKAIFTANSQLYFVADDDKAGEELFVSDGIAPPTLIDINEGYRSSEPANITQTDNGFVFTAYDKEHGTQIWICNEKDKVKRLTNFEREYGGDNISNLTPIGNKLYFTNNDGVTGLELWEVGVE